MHPALKVDTLRNGRQVILEQLVGTVVRYVDDEFQVTEHAVLVTDVETGVEHFVGLGEIQ